MAPLIEHRDGHIEDLKKKPLDRKPHTRFTPMKYEPKTQVETG
jgi:hypothetical protein